MAIGCGRWELSRLLISQKLVNPLHGVYRIGVVPEDPLERAKMASLVLPPGSAVVRRTAAWVLGVDARGPDERRDPIPVECAVSRGSTPIRRPLLR